ncbi:SRPBCC family protein [Streptomyces iconiensis]|uniref:SRPBCC family protein n=1 Tax=Streptomyces iconiensis TaxID=1384038 RepID=A0ABT6ZW42_9ACTN|nr:SRPBCC family protein [Streptomyces iconiensis]MDJ1133014.1 SRPBCC family protein [Streptomyces iconiensis]
MTPYSPSPPEDLMPEAFASAVVPADADTVWRVVRDFGGLDTWLPPVVRCDLPEGEAPDRVGCVRTLLMADGGTVVESLVALDDHTRALTYAIVSSPFPVHSYLATMRVLPLTTTDEAFVSWSVTFDCDPADADELTKTFRDDIFSAGLRALADSV